MLDGIKLFLTQSNAKVSAKVGKEENGIVVLLSLMIDLISFEQPHSRLHDNNLCLENP